MPKRTGSGSGIDLRKLARVGAEARLRELEGERLALLRAFPDLSHPSPTASVMPIPDASTPTAHERGAEEGHFAPDETLLGGQEEGR